MIDKAAITNSPDTIPVDEDCYDSVLQLLIEITTVKNKQPMDNPSGLISYTVGCENKFHSNRQLTFLLGDRVHLTK
jgi:hypothetical protein